MVKISSHIEKLMESNAYQNSSNPKHDEVIAEVDKYFKENFNNKTDRTVFRWIAKHDSNTCKTCQEMDGVEHENIEDFPFIPPIHPNCKCEIIEVSAPIQEGNINDKAPKNKDIDTEESLIEEIMPHLKEFEDMKYNAYTDTKGEVTIGYGYNVNNLNKFKNLNLYIDGRLATDEEKEREFKRISGKKDEQSLFTLLKKDKPLIEQWSKEHLKNDFSVIRNKLKEKDKNLNFDELPHNAKLVIMDMQYNMGGNFTNDKWPNFFEAIKQGDWKTAASESSSKDIGKKRNNWRYKNLLSIKD